MTKPIYDVRKKESILEIRIGVWYTIPSLTCLINIISFVFIDGDDVSHLIYLAFFSVRSGLNFQIQLKKFPSPLMTIIDLWHSLNQLDSTIEQLFSRMLLATLHCSFNKIENWLEHKNLIVVTNKKWHKCWWRILESEIQFFTQTGYNIEGFS